MSKLTQFYLLMYKNVKLQLRKKITTVFEIVLPALFCLLLVLIRTIVPTTNYAEPTIYKTYSVRTFSENLMQNFPFKFMRVAFTPNTAQTTRIMQLTASKLRNLNSGPFLADSEGFDGEQEMVDRLQFSNASFNSDFIYLAGVVFENPEAYKTAVPFNISYTFRFRHTLRNGSSTNDWKTGSVFPDLRWGPRDKLNSFSAMPSYYGEGFITLQYALHRSIIEILNPSVVNDSAYYELDTRMGRFPYPAYVDDPFIVFIQSFFAFLLVLALIFLALNIPKEIVHEKEHKLKEAMKMMGLNNWLHWLAWFTKFFVFVAITCILMTLLLCPPTHVFTNAVVLRHTNFGVFYVFLLLYCTSIICFCFMISVFFNKANAAAAAGGILFFLTYIPNSFISPRYDSMTKGAKMAACLLNNEALALGMYLIGKWEGAGVGAQWDNLNLTVTVDDNLTLGNVMFMMLLDCIIYIVIMWYVEAVKPGDYGLPQPAYFFLLPSYWCGTVQDKTLWDKTGSGLVGPDDVELTNKSEFFEPDPKNLEPGIRIKGLTKSFKVKGVRKIAVNNLSLNMYDGQITALLGHNGAGKTTTMFMLTGFFPPSRGTATVNGYDIQKDISSVRASLGLCPQHDILFDELTVEEHLYFFAKLKRCPAEKLQQEIDYYLKTLGLEEKRKSFSKTLSGGQKRKLSVGIALIGDSKIVILDEPTSGMDPSARRHMWDVLQAQRAGRTMILSTHFMDEADHLGDRIAIMADGVIQCYGSSLFLKSKYGAGYHMVMTKKVNCDVSKIESLILKHVPEAKMEGNIGAELSFVLPHERVSAFADLFRELEHNKDMLGILGYGASVTTMEEVFMKVGEGRVEEESNGKISEGSNSGIDNVVDDISILESPKEFQTKVNPVAAKNTGAKLFAQQFSAMFIKRFLYTIRNKLLTGSQLFMPLFFTALTVAIMKTMPDSTDLPLLPLNLAMFGNTTVFYGTNQRANNTVKAMADLYAGQFSAAQTAQGSSNVVSDILNTANVSLRKYNFQTIIAADFRRGNGSSSSVTTYFNCQPYHSQPVALLATDTALIKHFVNSSYSFSASNHPLPETTLSQIEELTKRLIGTESFAYSTNIMFGMAFLSSSFVVFLITERARKVKHSQIVSGVKGYNFWLSTFCWDFINYLVPAMLIVVLFAIGSVANLASTENGDLQPLYLIILLLLFGIAFLPSMYLIQFLFTAPATGYVVITFFNFLTGITPQLAVSILGVVNETATADLLDWVFVITFPNYNLGQGISNMYNNYDYLDLCLSKVPDVFNKTAGRDSLKDICQQIGRFNRTLLCCKDVPDVCGGTCLKWQTDYFAWESLGIGRSLLFLCVQAVVFWICITLIETEVIIKLMYKIRPKIYVVPELGEVQDDEDVTIEKTKILHNSEGPDHSSNPVVIAGLSKFFSNHHAVNELYVSIPKGECFGLLGVNGAGKTTTFKMLTGDETISGGTAFMNGNNIRTDIHEVQKSIGYCPQFDALIDQMTGEETLYMFARLRGVPEKSIRNVVNDLLEALLLKKHAKKLTMQYSGGNKRKLSTAIALMGDPPVVFLDEPTTGMDPVARRMLWETLSRVRDGGKTLILTTHSMEECEALCTRMAVMVNGKFRCLGSTQHLKNKFGAGYTLVARVSYPADGSIPDVKAVQSFVEKHFPASVLKDVHQNLVQYHIDKGEIMWADIFKLLEENKVILNIEDYSVSQTTLEQVFINFARSQIPPNEEQDGCSSRLRKTCCICCVPEMIVAADQSSRVTSL